MPKRKPLAERWAGFVRKTDTCWLWTGPMTRGYGSISRGDVRAIREMYAALPRKKYVERGSLTAMAKRFGIHPDIVRRVGSGESWKHIP